MRDSIQVCKFNKEFIVFQHFNYCSNTPPLQILTG